MSTPLKMFNLGFFLYGGQGNGAAADVLAASQVSLIPHESTLILPMSSILTVPDVLKAELKHGLLFIDLSGFAFQGSGTPAPARLVDFRHVPDFKDFVSGATLKADWRNSASLQFRFDLTGGTLAAVRLRGRDLRGWEWKTPQNQTKTACFSDVSLYLTDLGDAKPGLVFRPVTGSGEPATLTLKSGTEVPAVLLNLPGEEEMEGKSDDEVDFAHIHAMFRLCDVANPTVAFGSEIACHTTLAETPSHTGALGKFLTDFKPQLFGRPHCGGRLMFE